MPKRFTNGGQLEPYYVRRVRNEVDICNHLGRRACLLVWGVQVCPITTELASQTRTLLACHLGCDSGCTAAILARHQSCIAALQSEDETPLQTGRSCARGSAPSQRAVPPRHRLNPAASCCPLRAWQARQPGAVRYPCRSLNVCYLYEVFEDDTCVDLVMELCTGGQLWDK